MNIKGKMKKIIVFVLALMLSGCASDDFSLAGRKKLEPMFAGEIKGNYSALARCVVDAMEAHEKWSINALQHNVRIYPDIGKAEIQTYVHGGAWPGVFYVIYLELNKTAPNVSRGIVKGTKYEGGEAIKALQECAKK